MRFIVCRVLSAQQKGRGENPLFWPSPLSTNDQDLAQKKFFRIPSLLSSPLPKSQKHFFAPGFRPFVEGEIPKKCNVSLSHFAINHTPPRRPIEKVEVSPPFPRRTAGAQTQKKFFWLSLSSPNPKKNFLRPGFGHQSRGGAKKSGVWPFTEEGSVMPGPENRTGDDRHYAYTYRPFS